MTDWTLAGCTGDPEAMFEETTAAVAYNRRVCAACPILLDCREWALEQREPWGMWGGLTPAERERTLGERVRRKAAARHLKPCGTAAAARRHQRNGEELDEACREAAAQAQKVKWAKDPDKYNARRNARRRPVRPTDREEAAA